MSTHLPAPLFYNEVVIDSVPYNFWPAANITLNFAFVMSQLIIVYLAGLFSFSDVQNMMCEVNKMKDFHHPHVMSLIGVCLDAGPGIAIVMPYIWPTGASMTI